MTEDQQRIERLTADIIELRTEYAQMLSEWIAKEASWDKERATWIQKATLTNKRIDQMLADAKVALARTINAT